jgi:hypothetical protein
VKQIKITKLTAAQEEYIPRHIEKYIQMASQPINWEIHDAAVTELYKRLNMPRPLILHFDSPIACKIVQTIIYKMLRGQLYGQLRDQLDGQLYGQLGGQLYGQLGGQLGGQLDGQLYGQLYGQLGGQLDGQLGGQLDGQLRGQLRDQLGGQLGYYWLSIWWLYVAGWYSYMKYIGVVFDEKILGLFLRFTEQTCFSIPYQHIYIVSDRPILIRWKSKMLHCDNGPSVRFRDGYELYALNGVRVNKDIVMIPAEKLAPNLVLTEKNAEVRREIVRKIGIERVMQKLNAKIIDKWEEYELLELPIEGMRTKAVYLKMKNPSIGTYHVEGVPSDIKTCQAALSWRVGGIKWEPNQLT